MLQFKPDHYALDLSERRGWDRFYTPPMIVETFVQRANKELPYGAYAMPQSLARRVNVFDVRGRIFHRIPYEKIEADVVGCLDYICAETKRRYQNADSSPSRGHL